ncbi:MAG: RNA 2',3'-cyclic phosphodiesterase [Gammaproteobacteria bacterium]|nr:RNA 2',3'-cyclic phosphodiesterase [Gammaproteobacteria bacterium]
MPRSGKRRLFFALWPDDDLRTRIVRATRAEVRGTGGKPTPPENLHMTLHFLGPAPEELIAPLVERVSVLPLDPFELTLDQYGYWQRARTLWLGLQETPPTLAELARDLGRISNELGLPRERRAFIPHMTLARKVNRLTPREPPRPMHWFVHEFALVESVLGGPHSRYTILEHFG